MRENNILSIVIYIYVCVFISIYINKCVYIFIKLEYDQRSLMFAIVIISDHLV